MIAAILVTSAAAGLSAAWIAPRYAECPRGLAAACALAGGAAAAWAAAIMPGGWLLAASLVLGVSLLLLAVIDALTLRLPDPLTLPLILAGLFLSAALPGAPWAGHLAGAALGYGVLAGLAALWRRWRGQDGIGLGDAKLLAAAGAWLGWDALPSVLLLGSLGGLAWAAVIAAAGRNFGRAQPFPFGPPLCLAFWLVWLYGPLRIGG